MEGIKDSGIRFIGLIPKEWTIKRIKYVISDIKDGTHGTFDRVEEGFPLLSAKNVFDDGLHITDFESEISEKDYLLITANGFPKKNDVIMCCVGTVGRVCVYDLDKSMAFQRSVTFLRPNDNTFSKYLKYCLQSDPTLIQESQLINKSAQDGLYMGAVQELIIPYTESRREQQAIADFLDDKCSQIDGIIADIEKQIEILKSYKKSLITETVTKGLDKNVKMKDSGVEWIGQIPEHWDVKRLKYVLDNGEMRVGPFGSTLSTSDYIENGKWVFNQRLVLDENFDENEICISDEKYKELIGFKVYPGDILITTRGTIGKTTIVPEGVPEGILHPCIIRFRTNPIMLSSELVRIIFNETDLLKKQVEYMSNSTTIEVIYSYSLKEVYVPVIPDEEQQEIIEFTTKKIDEIDSIITTKQTQLTKMQQHKKSLIYEYVTGKKRVAI